MTTPPGVVAQSSQTNSPLRQRPTVNVPSSSPRAMPVVSPRSVPVAIPSPRAVPLPVPQRHGSVSVGSFHGGGSFQASSFHGASSLHGSISSLSDLMAVSPRMRSSHRSSGSVGSFGGPASLSNSFVLDPVATDSSDSWLQTQAGDIALESVPIIPATSGLEEATEVLIKSNAECILVQSGDEYELFDVGVALMAELILEFADLNTVLLLVLSAATKESVESLDERAREVVSRLKRGVRVSVRAVCDISGKNPASSFAPDATFGHLLPLFASGVHRVILTTQPRRVLEASALLAYLTRLPPPMFRLSLSEIDLPLHRFVSLPVNASVMDAMQVMSLNGLGVLGVVTGEAEREGEPSALVGVVTVSDCSKLVVPSEGKQALGMGLVELCKRLMSSQDGARERGEERVPGTTLLHAANILLATASSRVFMRTPAESPPLSPISSFDCLSPVSIGATFAGLPNPPSTQVSSQYVISVLDILSCLARAYQSKISPAVDNTDDEAWLPDTVSKRRRRASSSAAFSGFQTWRWAGDPSPFAT